MNEDFAASLTNPSLIIAVLVAIAVFATLYTIAIPFFERGNLDKRMKAAINGQPAQTGRSSAIWGPVLVSFLGGTLAGVIGRASTAAGAAGAARAMAAAREYGERKASL